MRHLKGQLLISTAGLYDPHFRHTVVLIGEHDESGAVGVVINRPLATTVGETIPALAHLTGPDAALFEGGPVAPDQAVLIAAADRPDILDLPVFGSVGFLTGEVPAEVRRALRGARVFLGHAGWGPGQLEAELEQDSWIVEAAAEGDVFSGDPAGLWRRLLERKGPPYDRMARVPFDPSLN